jgi:hypothetical protein
VTALAYPAALRRLASPESFDSMATANVTSRHLRHMIGNDLPEAVPVDDAAVVDHWVEYFVDRILDKKDTWAIVDGEHGEGKSNFTLWLGSKIRRRLGEETGTAKVLDLEHDVVYRLTTFTHRVYESSRQNPSVVIADEGVLIGAQGTSGLSDAGRILDRVLSVGRIQACTGFLLHPNVWGLASFVRNRRAKVLFHVEHRGLTTAFTLKSAMDFVPPRQLPFKKARQPWAKIRWPSLENDPIWQVYEPNKLETTKQTLVDSEIEAAKLEKKAGLRPPGPWAMDYWSGVGSGRAEGETPEEYHRRGARERARAKAAERLRQRAEAGRRQAGPATAAA